MEKAIALAALAHGKRRKAAERLYSVIVVETAPVDTDEANIAILRRTDLTDRMEW